MSRGLISISNQNYSGARGRTPRPPKGDDPWYAKPMVVRKVDENSTATTATNTTTETTLASLSLPALTLSSTGAARLTAVGTIDKNSTGTTTFRVKVADDSSTSTVLATDAIEVASSTDTHVWSLEAWLLGKQPSVNRAWGDFSISVAGSGASLLASTFSSVGFSTMGLDETEEWTVEITVQMSDASTSYTVTGQASILEGVN